ncbi:hypothetical protein [Pantoea sp. 18069]|uniref:hypothetical protein n=1 Tax=Pantoea sp. 18069 TaxID=2681415 RepID=UPI00190FB526|nr:hypothetical protein [Pantoea sp. 18069]
MEQVNDQRFDVEAQHAATVIAIYTAATGRGEASWCREPATEQAKWERAALAAFQIHQAPHATLAAVGAVAACFGDDWPDVPGEPEILRRVKWAARQLQAARALPAGMEPVARVCQGAGANIQWRKGMTYADLPAIDGQDLYTAAQVQAMGRVPPEWQAVPMESTRTMKAAGRQALKGAADCTSTGQAVIVFEAMCAAAPRPPAAPTTEPQAPTTGAGSVTAGAAPAYRLLQRGVDTIQAGDEFLQDDAVTWQPDPNGIFVGITYVGNVLLPARRAIEPAHGLK